MFGDLPFSELEFADVGSITPGSGDFGPPFRAPCDGWPPVPNKTSGGCYQHRKFAAENVAAFSNTTKVDDWRDPLDPDYQAGGIPPYPRKSDGGCSNPPCSHDSCHDDPWPDTGDCPGICGSPCNPEATFEQLCGSWFTGVTPGDPPGPGLRSCSGTRIDWNCYEHLTILSAVNSGPNVVIVTNQPHCLRTGQVVRVTNVPGVTGSYSVTVSNDVTFTIVAHMTAPYPGSGLVNLDLSVCRKVGFKNAQARKSWHGLFGWSTEWNGICYELSFPGGDVFPCTPAHACGVGCGCTWEPYQGSPPVDRYLDWDVAASTSTIVGGVTTAFATLHRKVSVARYTGCQSIIACSDSYSDLGTFEALQGILAGSTSVDPCSLGHSSTLPAKGAFDIPTMLGFFRPVANDFTCSGTVVSTRIGCEPTYLCQSHDIPSGNLITELSVDATTGDSYFKTWDTDGNLLCQIDINVSETVTHFKVHGFSYAGGVVVSEAITEITNTLSSPYTSDELYADILTLLARIDMSDDIRYPWRTDGFISIAPFVTYDEAPPTSPDPGAAIASTCPISPTDCAYTGDILGDLLPEGYGPHFAWNHRTWRSCQAPAFSAYYYAWGAWAKNPPPSPVDPYTFTSCPPAVCAGGTLPVVSFSSSGGTLFFKTNSTIPGWTGPEPVVICGTNEIDGIYNISGPTGTGPYEYSVIAPQINNAPFQTGCAGGVVGVVNVNADATFYTVGDATDLAMPATATQWTENWNSTLSAGDMPPGAWLIHTNGYTYAQKWAEIKIHRPSYNFARPCGVDKWMLDESKVTCVESSDGANPPVLTIYADIGLATNDLCYVCGVSGPPGVTDGVYKITRSSATTVTLTTDCTMRRILSATQSGPNVDIVMTDPMLTISSGDSVDLVGVPGLGAGLTVTVTDSTHFSVPGTLTGAYPGGGFAFVSGSGAFQIAPNTIDFNCSPDPDANGIIGKIRFADVPGICGRIGVASATQSGSEVIITTGANYLAQGESVDFTGVGGLGSGLTVTVLSSTSFKVTGTLSGPYTTGGFVSVTGAAAYQWDDDQSKGNFLFANFEFNERDFQQADRMCYQYHGGSYDVCGAPQTGCNECASAAPGFTCVEVSPGVWESDVRQTQSANGIDRAITNFTIDELCLPFDSCNPQIMAIVPEGSPEDFPQPSHVENFPASFLSDWRYGSRWQAFYLQAYPDLLAQVPHKPCIVCDCDGCPQPFIPSNCPQQQDDGSCESDTCIEECTTHSGNTFYAHFPEVEALQDVPTGAPVPPVGNIGFPTYSALSSGPVDPEWSRLMPPMGPGYGSSPGAGGVDPTLPAQPETPWTLAINEWLCVCASGRFKDEYLANGQSVNCPH